MTLPVGEIGNNGRPRPTRNLGGGLCGRFRRLLEICVLLVKFINLPGGIDELLFPGEEGMALGTDFHRVITAGGHGMDRVTAGAGNGNLR